MFSRMTTWMTRIPTPRSYILLLCLLFCAGCARTPGVLFLIRHAERADESDDTLLSPAGEARAQSLARLLKDAGITAIYTSQYRRSVDTAAPLAAALRLRPRVLPAEDTAGLARALRHERAALVVSHSHLLPGLLQALGAPAITLARGEYDNLFLLISDGAAPPRLVRLHF
jgi:broad specificity phosphatase PhoE